MNRTPSDIAPKPCNEAANAARRLYEQVSAQIARDRDAYRQTELGEQMLVVNTLIIDHWKPRYLLNRNTRCAYEFMNAQAHLTAVSDAEIDWASLRGVPEEYLFRVRTRNALFPSYIGTFRNGTAQVKWQINPDGRYWMDDDGFGMTPDEEFNLYGFIDTAGRVVVPFRAVENREQLEEMRAEAEKRIAAGG